MNQEQIDKAVNDFKVEVCDRFAEVDPHSEEDWYALSLGYFLAKGLSIEESRFTASKVRYTHHYWQK